MVYNQEKQKFHTEGVIDMNKKLTATFSLIGLTTATFLSLSAVNKAIDKLAVSKNLLDDKKKEIYHWRFGDIRYSV